MSTLGLYHPGDTVVHRLPAGAKVLALIACIVAITVGVRQPWQLAPAALLVGAAYAVARIPVRAALAQLRPLLWMLLIIGAFQLVFTGWVRAALVCGTLLLSVAAAALLSLTTRVTDMLDAITTAMAPLRRFGVNPDRIALVLAMTIRCIPLMSGIVQRVADARKARGLGFSLRALAVPVVVSTLMTADAMGEALAARGADD
ncbi:energy-coupling factor transporter transmembrane component T family protein [Rhodococcus tibetensis]|uniref:Energy-coupling factor transporter transmembrane protein EcfT n=1 Tax=Rhodococcus tibetensis TaxID=2965064 RepID=A0ABT1QAY5_9NOCA|nr:energy-coupling factor transporter transmembrane protein EcfT [Rhodococcus sp. FXJ9.536]MCQ4119418.1 energy-coupling factor transporter transmembrane protein EcfT [Rhodococcus sp. FXJ9.536]